MKTTWLDEITFPPLSTPTGLQQSSLNSELKLYPNPMREVSFIHYTINQNTKVSIYVTDIQGKRLLTLKESENQMKGEYTIGLHRSMLPAGTYIVELVLGNTVNTQKLVITE